MVSRGWQFAKFYPNTVGIRSAVGLQYKFSWSGDFVQLKQNDS